MANTGITASLRQDRHNIVNEAYGALGGSHRAKKWGQEQNENHPSDQLSQVKKTPEIENKEGHFVSNGEQIRGLRHVTPISPSGQEPQLTHQPILMYWGSFRQRISDDGRKAREFGGHLKQLADTVEQHLGRHPPRIKPGKCLRIAGIASSLGGIESLIEQPLVMSYYEMPAADRQRFGILDYMSQLSFGIENTENLIADLEQALEAT